MTRKQKLRAICWIAGLCLFCALYPGTAAAQVQPQTKEITAPTLEQDVQTEMTLETPGQTDIVRPSLQEHEAEHLLRLVRQYGATKYCGLWFAGTAYWAR